MKLNFDVEPDVREALAAAVGQEPDRYDAAVLAIANKGDTATVEALNLGLAVAGFAFFDLHEGEEPDDEQLNSLAGRFVQTEGWAEIEKADALQVLTALVKREPVDLPPADLAEIIFPLAAWLLSAFGPEDREWNQYLDQILNDLESAAEQSK